MLDGLGIVALPYNLRFNRNGNCRRGGVWASRVILRVNEEAEPQVREDVGTLEKQHLISVGYTVSAHELREHKLEFNEDGFGALLPNFQHYEAVFCRQWKECDVPIQARENAQGKLVHVMLAQRHAAVIFVASIHSGCQERLPGNMERVSAC